MGKFGSAVTAASLATVFTAFGFSTPGVMAADIEAPRHDRIRLAAKALGLEDDPDRATHPGDRFRKRLERWHAAAGGAGHFVQPRRGDAA